MRPCSVSLDRDKQAVALIHQQGFAVRSKGLVVGVAWTGRAGRNSVPLYESKVRGFRAIGVAVAVRSAFQAIDVQRCTPVFLVAADLRNKRWESRGIELHFQER
jgi:hypothetical protein